MTAATQSIDTPERAGKVLTDLPIEANTIVYVGTIACRNAAGNLVPGADAANLRVLGCFIGTTRTTLSPDAIVGSDGNNLGGNAGAVTGNVRRGVFEWNNSEANPVTAAMIGQNAYVEDDNTVNFTGGANKVVAGEILGISPDGTKVYVDVTSRRAIGLAMTSAQNATAAAADLPTAEALANALKANYNQLQADVAALYDLLS